MEPTSFPPPPGPALPPPPPTSAWPPPPPGWASLPPPPAPAGPSWIGPTLVVVALVGTFVAALLTWGVSWFASCGPAIIGQAETEPPTIDELQFTLGGYGVAFLVAASVPAIGLVKAVRDRRDGLIWVWAMLLLAVALLTLPQIFDVTRALVAGEPGDYCISRGYSGG